MILIKKLVFISSFIMCFGGGEEVASYMLFTPSQFHISFLIHPSTLSYTASEQPSAFPISFFIYRSTLSHMDAGLSSTSFASL